MERPSIEIHEKERILEEHEIQQIPCAAKIREHVSKQEGLFMDSEKVTYDDAFGYIFRYDINRLVIDDGTFHPENNTKGQVFEIKWKIIVYSKTGEFVHFLHIPLWEPECFKQLKNP